VGVLDLPWPVCAGAVPGQSTRGINRGWNHTEEGPMLWQNCIMSEVADLPKDHYRYAHAEVMVGLCTSSVSRKTYS